MIIGVVGQIASGKGVLVNLLTDHFGFKSFSLSSIVHDELKKRGIKKFDRKILQDIGDELRKKEGDDVLARLAFNQMKNEKLKMKNWVIEGIRNPGEIEFFKKNPNFILIGVKAKRELRFQRLLSRNKQWDPKNWKEFLKVDRRDLGLNEDKSGQQVGECLKFCDYTLTNNKSVQEFEKKVEKLMS